MISNSFSYDFVYVLYSFYSHCYRHCITISCMTLYIQNHVCNIITLLNCQSLIILHFIICRMCMSYLHISIQINLMIHNTLMALLIYQVIILPMQRFLSSQRGWDLVPLQRHQTLAILSRIWMLSKEELDYNCSSLDPIRIHQGMTPNQEFPLNTRPSNSNDPSMQEDHSN